MALRAEIASLLAAVDAGGTMLRAALEDQSGRVRAEVLAAIGVLGSDFAEMGFLVRDIAQAAATIQHALDVQGADVRAIIEQNTRQSADIRVVREDVAAIARRQGGTAPASTHGPASAPRWENGCPYRGLLPFAESDAEVFYGRERLIAELAVKVARQAASGGIVVVTGASGAGKSSLLRAGLLPTLAQGRQVAGSARWPRIAFTPAADPLTELAARLAALSAGNTVEIRDSLFRHPEQAHQLAWQAVLAHQDAAYEGACDSALRLVLIVDQFEQVFTLNPDPEGESARRAFIAALHAAASVPVGARQQPPAVVVVTVRGDFCDRCAAYPELANALQRGQFVVGPMTESDLRLAITGPAEAAGLRIDPVLTDTILGDLRAAGRDRAGVLPLLSQAMALTWDKRDGDRLTSRGYDQAGGVRRAVQTTADSVYDALDIQQQALTRGLLRTMTIADRDGRLTRRPAGRTELYAGHPDADRSQVDAVLEAFAAQRLIVLNDHTAQLSHDVLLTAWPRLQGWLEEDRASWILHGQLVDDAASSHDSGRDPSFLYRGTQLTTVRHATVTWAANPARYPALTGAERDFLSTGEHAAARSTRQRRGAVALLAFLAVAAVIAAGFAYQQRAAALSQRDEAIYDNTIAQALQAGGSDPSLAAEIDLAAYEMKTSHDLDTTLLSTENTPLSDVVRAPGTSTVSAVAFSPKGGILASGGGDSGGQLWDVADPDHPRPFGSPLAVPSGTVVNSVAFSPDGRTLAIGGSGGALQLWNVSQPAHPRPFSPPLPIARSVGIYTVAFSPSGRVLAIGGTDGALQLWNVSEPAHPRPDSPLLTTAQGNTVRSVAFSHDGTTLASSGDDDAIQLWRLTDPRQPRSAGQTLSIPQSGSVTSLAFSPDGRTLAGGDFGGSTGLWGVGDPGQPRLLGEPLQTAHGDSVYSVAFNPDGRTLATGGTDGTLQLWDAAVTDIPQPLGQPLTSSDGSGIASVAFSPDGRTLAAGGEDGTIRLWNMPQTILTGSTGAISSVAFSPDGRTLASGSNDGKVWLWDVASATRPGNAVAFRAADGSGQISSLAFSPGGGVMATGDTSGAVRLWDVADPSDPHMLSQPWHSGSACDGICFVAFSHAHHILAAAGEDGIIQLWNIADPAHPQPLASQSAGSTIYALAFSPDDRTLAAGQYDGKVTLWNVIHPEHLQLFRPALFPVTAGTAVLSVVFSPDGRTLAITGGDSKIRFWDVASPAHAQPFRSSIGNNGRSVYGATFSPDGRTLATGDQDGTVQLWNVADPARPVPFGQPLTISPASAGVFAVAFSPDGRTLATGSGDTTTRLWDLNLTYAIGRICSTTTNVLTHQQWHAYIPQLPYQPPCG